MSGMLHAEPSAADRTAAKLDTRWFRAHPGRTRYERDALPGERKQYGLAPGARMAVLKLAPGMHARIPLESVGVN